MKRTFLIAFGLVVSVSACGGGRLGSEPAMPGADNSVTVHVQNDFGAGVEISTRWGGNRTRTRLGLVGRGEAEDFTLPPDHEVDGVHVERAKRLEAPEGGEVVERVPRTRQALLRPPHEQKGDGPALHGAYPTPLARGNSESRLDRAMLRARADLDRHARIQCYGFKRAGWDCGCGDG